MTKKQIVGKDGRWEADEGDFIFVESSKYSSKVFGWFEGVFDYFRNNKASTNGQGNLSLMPSYRISLEPIPRTRLFLPSVTPIYHDKRRTDEIRRITIGNINVANRLREISKAYEPYAQLIESDNFHLK